MTSRVYGFWVKACPSFLLLPLGRMIWKALKHRSRTYYLGIKSDRSPILAGARSKSSNDCSVLILKKMELRLHFCWLSNSSCLFWSTHWSPADTQGFKRLFKGFTTSKYLNLLTPSPSIGMIRWTILYGMNTCSVINQHQSNLSSSLLLMA